MIPLKNAHASKNAFYKKTCFWIFHEKTHAFCAHVTSGYIFVFFLNMFSFKQYCCENLLTIFCFWWLTSNMSTINHDFLKKKSDNSNKCTWNQVVKNTFFWKYYSWVPLRKGIGCVFVTTKKMTSLLLELFLCLKGSSKSFHHLQCCVCEEFWTCNKRSSR